MLTQTTIQVARHMTNQLYRSTWRLAVNHDGGSAHLNQSSWRQKVPELIDSREEQRDEFIVANIARGDEEKSIRRA